MVSWKASKRKRS